MKKIIIAFLGLVSVGLFVYALLNIQPDTQRGAEGSVEIPAEQPSDSNLGRQQITEFTQNTLDSFQSTHAGQYGWQDFVYQGVEVSTSVGLEALAVPVISPLENILSSKNWGVYSCRGLAGAPTYVLRVEIQLLPDYKGGLYSDLQQFMKSWETTLVNDTQPILFPSEFYSTIQRVSVFSDSPVYEFEQVRAADVSLSDGSSGIIGYQWVGDALLISNNIDCMVTTSESVVDMVI